MASLSAVEEPANLNSIEDLLLPEFRHLKLWMPKNHNDLVTSSWLSKQVFHTINIYGKNG